MTEQKHAPLDLTRLILQVLWIGILIAATFWIMRPFIPSFIWAATIVMATWPLYAEGGSLAMAKTGAGRRRHDACHAFFVHRSIFPSPFSPSSIMRTGSPTG